MDRSEVEHDFLGLNSNSNQQLSGSQRGLQRRQSFRGITKMKPEIVRKVMAWASKTALDQESFRAETETETEKRSEKEQEDTSVYVAAPLTIFYKGTVTVVDLPQDKADSVFKFVATQSSSVAAPTHNHPRPVDSPTHTHTHTHTHTDTDGDLPIKRNKSLQRFFEKRKQRLISVSPCHVDHVSQLRRKSFA